MRLRKILALFAGLLVSICLLILLDRYAPQRGMQALEKTQIDAETTRFLNQIASESLWGNYDIPTFKRDHTLKDFRQFIPYNDNHPHYEVPVANQHATHELMILREGDRDFIRIFRAHYSVDSHARRTTINSKLNPEMSLVLLGCSFTWGSGVEDDDTWASVIAREEPRLHVYNLGARGIGPNDVIDDLQEHPHRWEDIRTKKGLVLYTFIADHFDRALCGPSCYAEPRTYFNGHRARNRRSKSHYALENGELVHRGYFQDESRVLLWMKKWIFRSLILSSLYSVWTEDIVPEDMTPVAKMLEKIMIESKKKTGYDFLVVFFPDHEFKRLEEFKAELDQLGVPHIDYAHVKFNEALGERGFFAVDGHPSRLGNEAFGRLLLRDLRKREPLKELVLSSRR